MIKTFLPLICVTFLMQCVDLEKQVFESRIVGNWWRCKYISGDWVMYDDKDVSKSNCILTFDNNIFKEYYIWDSGDSGTTLLMSWPYYFENEYLIRKTKQGDSYVGKISYKNDSLIIERYANNADERMYYVKYDGVLPPLSWPQNIMIDTTS